MGSQVGAEVVFVVRRTAEDYLGSGQVSLFFLVPHMSLGCEVGFVEWPAVLKNIRKGAPRQTE